jgi:hypothetical protein
MTFQQHFSNESLRSKTNLHPRVDRTGGQAPSTVTGNIPSVASFQRPAVRGVF